MNNQDGSEDNNLQEFKNIKFQKLVYFAEKVGIIGDKQMNIDQDLKDDIEDTYTKIVKKLKTEEFGVKCMQNMLRLYESTKDENGGSTATSGQVFRKRPERCSSFELERRTSKTIKARIPKDAFIVPKTQFAADRQQREFANLHYDVVKPSIKSKTLEKAIKTCTNKVHESKAVTPWRYTGLKVQFI